MIKDILGMKEKKRTIPTPTKEKRSKTVPAKRFNDMIEYYTAELKSRIAEIKQLRHDNEMLIKTSLRNAARSDENRLRVEKLQEDLRKVNKR